MRSAAVLAALSLLSVGSTSPLSDITPLVTACLTGIAAVLAAYATVRAKRASTPDPGVDEDTECQQQLRAERAHNADLSRQLGDQEQRLIAANDREMTHLSKLADKDARIARLEAENRRLKGSEPR